MDLTWLAGWFGAYGPAGAMGLSLVYGLYRELLVPRATVDRLERVWAARLAEAKAREDQWRLAFLSVSGRADRMMTAAEQVVETARSTLASESDSGEDGQA